MIKTLTVRDFLVNNIADFKGLHEAEDIWVIAAGPSMNYVNNSFFENKVTIGINRVAIKFECDYLVAKDGRGFGLISKHISPKTKLVLSKHESGNLHQNLNSYNGEFWTFEHPSKPGEKPNLSCISKNSDKIVVSYSTITSGIHLAAYMGAKNIIICGHDCGTIDSQSTIDGYYTEIRQHQGNEASYVKWLSEIENHTAMVSQKIKEVYNCNIHSLNPFINFNLEGHTFVPSNTTRILQRKLN